MVTTYNHDPRSMLLNSESGFLLRGEESSNARAAHIQELISQSHIFGSKEWFEIRSKVKGPKKFVIEQEALLFEALMKLRLWWLI